MKWMRERDLLIAQTMAFVQSVTGKKPDAESCSRYRAASTVPEPPVDAPHPTLRAAFMPDIEALLADTTIAVAPRSRLQIAAR